MAVIILNVAVSTELLPASKIVTSLTVISVRDIPVRDINFREHTDPKSTTNKISEQAKLVPKPCQFAPVFA